MQSKKVLQLLRLRQMNSGVFLRVGAKAHALHWAMRSCFML